MDLENYYLHIIVAPGSDDSSQCQMRELLEFNTVLKYCVKHFKTGIVQYEARDNQDLRAQLYKVGLSCQRGLLENRLASEVAEKLGVSEEDDTSYVLFARR